MKITSKKRDKLPKSDFGMPGSRKYPMPDKSHASNAKVRATQMENRGKISSSTKEKIDVKADRILGKSTKDNDAKARTGKRKSWVG